MLDLLIATTNPGKLREYREIFASLPLRLLNLADVGLGQMDVDETGVTFSENAELKAVAYAKASGLYALADDSGLMIDALGGLPGLYSHRYAGPDASDADRYHKVLRELADVPDEQRTARFICVTALTTPATLTTVTTTPATLTTVTTTGIVEGRIGYEPDQSGGGFGYDPIFIPEGYTIALSALPAEEKHQLSHRGRAALLMRPILERLLDEVGG